MSRFEVIRGVEGCCLALDDTRIAGPKPWGGGTVIHAWETDKEYKAVETCELVEVDSYSNANEVIHVLECSACGQTCEHVNGSYPKCPHCGRSVKR